MNRKIMNIVCTLCLVFLTYNLSGCSLDQINYRRIYSGEPLPRNEVAIVLKPVDCYITAVEEHGKPAKQTPLLWGDIELLPGNYTLYIHYAHVDSGYNTTTVTKSNQPVPVQFTAMPGRIYVIYPEISGAGTWRPVIIDNVTDKNFEATSAKYLLYSIPDHVDKILRGERRPIRLTEKGYWE